MCHTHITRSCGFVVFTTTGRRYIIKLVSSIAFFSPFYMKWTAVINQSKLFLNQTKLERSVHSRDVAPHRSDRACSHAETLLICSFFLALILAAHFIPHPLLPASPWSLSPVTLKSAAHLPDVPQEMVAGCREKLEQSPCKELFNDCTK